MGNRCDHENCDHPVCATCEGDARVRCSECRGDGFDPLWMGQGPQECWRCDGSGKEDCPDCDRGYVVKKIDTHPRGES